MNKNNNLFTLEEIQIANATSRANGAVGHNAIVPRLILEIAKKTDNILDFGAGKRAIHTLYLREQGLNVIAYEFGNNIDLNLHSIDALSKKYNIVFASNVLNVQSSAKMLRNTLKQISNVIENKGKFIVNYPQSPRKGNFTVDFIITELENYFKNISIIHGTHSNPVFQAIK